MYPGGFDSGQAAPWAIQQPPAQPQLDQAALDAEEGDTSHRPPNAFILYSQNMRSSARQDNPALSNTEVSRLLGKMWKEVPNETKMQYKQKAAKMQEEFKRAHPDYTYRKARRKRALNELLTKSTQGANAMMFQADPMGMYQQMLQQQYQPVAQQFGGQNPAGMMYPSQMAQMGAQIGLPQGLQAGVPQGMGQLQGMPQMQGMQQAQMMYMPTQYAKQE
jgi:transcription factor SOX7/8/10/18 (SOX group E/F)